MVSKVPQGEGRHLIFRAENGNTDCWIKYIPDTENVKVKTLFATASDSLFEKTRGCKNKLSIREYEELSESNPDLAPFFGK